MVPRPTMATFEVDRVNVGFAVVAVASAVARVVAGAAFVEAVEALAGAAVAAEGDGSIA
jgi:hypothetical protein